MYRVFDKELQVFVYMCEKVFVQYLIDRYEEKVFYYIGDDVYCYIPASEILLDIISNSLS